MAEEQKPEKRKKPDKAGYAEPFVAAKRKRDQRRDIPRDRRTHALIESLRCDSKAKFIDMCGGEDKPLTIKLCSW